ncbi:hypothetical protein [Nostoc sp. 106C]|uniref:hypothetical protein n=1 Tax=Nostoc sp. 106C TaxID=1932667 RepID=UPI00117E159F|nr:hypothetical protein [Nostoc sp. 106C]
MVICPLFNHATCYPAGTLTLAFGNPFGERERLRRTANKPTVLPTSRGTRPTQWLPNAQCLFRNIPPLQQKISSVISLLLGN